MVPHDHPLGKKDRISLADLKNQPMISLPPDSYTRRVIEGAAAATGLWLQHTVIVPGFLDILNFVAAGVGIGIVPGGVLSDRFLTRLKPRPLVKPALTISMGLIALRTRHVTPAASGLMKLLVETVRAQQLNLRTKYLSSAGSLDELPHGPYELLWRPATSVDASSTPAGTRVTKRTRGNASAHGARHTGKGEAPSS